MKLDYLQFLELELFTRFGAKLEAGMQNTIARGRLLRELLKQDRLSPVPIEFDMAWLLAFNAGLLNNKTVAEIPALLRDLAGHVRDDALPLDADREQWLRALRFLSGTAKGDA